jgi:hypothetical protein
MPYKRVQIILGGIAAVCGTYLWIRLGSEMPEGLEFPVYSMIFLGLLIMSMNIRWMMKERSTMKNAHLPVNCPSCDSKKGLRFTNDGGLRLTCIDCKEVDEDIDPNKIFDVFIAVVQYSCDNESLDETLTDIILSKLGVPEFEEEEEEEEDDASE